MNIYTILLVVIVLGAAKRRGRGRRRYSLRRVRVSPALTLSTLGAQTVLAVGVTGTSDAQYRLVTAMLTWSQVGLTASEGPITVGFAHNDYTVTEIKECIEIAGSISPGDKIAQEKANRWVRIVGTFEAEAESVLNDGKPIKTRLNWPVQIGSAVNIFAYNESGSALATGAVINAQGNLWVKDY